MFKASRGQAGTKAMLQKVIQGRAGGTGVLGGGPGFLVNKTSRKEMVLGR